MSTVCPGLHCWIRGKPDGDPGQPPQRASPCLVRRTRCNEEFAQRFQRVLDEVRHLAPALPRAPRKPLAVEMGRR
eukprot:15459987-Alexandrium_andersonii.AAC.2